MSEPSPKRLKADEGDVGTLKAHGVDQEAGEGTIPADTNGGLEEGAADFVEDRWAADLEDCQKALDKVNDEASDRVLAVEQEYNKKRRPIYGQRAEIIKKVPLFWQRTLTSHPALADQLSDDDTAILEFMSELDVIDFDDIKSGFKIVLTFTPQNPYFSNPTLTKSFHYGDDGKVVIEAASIDWKQGFVLMGEFGPSYIFFTWMVTNEPVGEGTPDEIAEVLKDEIWPNPVKYYYNELSLLEPEFEDMDDEGVVMEGEEFEVLPGGAEGENEDEDGLDEAVYDEAEMGPGEGLGDEGDLAGGEGGEGFGDDGAAAGDS